MYVWVIEMWNDKSDQWEPTIDSELIKVDAILERVRWQEDNPDDRFREVQYFRSRAKGADTMSV